MPWIVKVENADRAAQRRDDDAMLARLTAEQDESEIAKAMSDPFLGEDREKGRRGHRFSPDHFKGLTEGQVAALYRENGQVVSEKEARRQEEREEERMWEEQRRGVLREMEEAECLRQLHVAREMGIQKEILEVQRKELREKQERMKQDKFGKIEEGFFQGFGTSCR